MYRKGVKGKVAKTCDKVTGAEVSIKLTYYILNIALYCGYFGNFLPSADLLPFYLYI